MKTHRHNMQNLKKYLNFTRKSLGISPYTIFHIIYMYADVNYVFLVLQILALSISTVYNNLIFITSIYFQDFKTTVL